MKKIISYFLFGCVFSVCGAQAQSNKPGAPIGGVVVKGGKNPGGSMLLNVGGGISNPDTKSQSQNYLENGFNVNGGLYIPMLILDKGGIVGTGQTVHFFTLGPNFGGSYFSLNGTEGNATSYNVTGQTSAPTTSKSATGNASGFTAEAGLHANFSFGKITLSPVLNGAYLKFKQDAFAVKQTSQVNGKSNNFDLYSQQETKESGFAFIPKLRIGYFPGKLGLYLESNYTIGPDITTKTSNLKPLGSGNDKDGSYQLDQLMAGKQVASERHTPFHNLAVNFGLSYAISKPSKTKGEMANAIKAGNPLYESSGSSGSNPLFDQKATVGNPTNQPQNQSIVNTTKSNTKDRTAELDAAKNIKMMQVSYNGNDPILKATKLSISGTGETLPNGTPIVAGREVKGVITGSVIIASGSSRITNTITITQPETGDKGSSVVDDNGNFIVKLGSDTLHRVYINDKEFGKIKIESGDGNGAPQNQSIINTTKSNTKDRVATGLEGTDGSGANPTGQPQNQSIINTSKSNTKDRVATGLEGTDGEGANPAGQPQNQSIVNTTKSNTKDKISTAPQSPLYQAQNTEHMSPLYKGNALARPGEPIGGIIVKGGRNPGGQMKLVSNSNGEITFSNPKTADFQFTIETPETSTSNGNNARPGEPIGGIVVKGGRNPGGQMFTLTSDPNGVVTIKNLPAGNYKFKVTAPTDTKQYESFRKGWDGTVKGGSKKSINKENPTYQPQNTEHMSPLYKGN